jgi:D-sedoheptulose 7-phosphate isomerase
MENRMNDETFARSEIAKTVGVLLSMHDDASLLATVSRVAKLGAAAIRRGNKVLFCGNGGSAADSQHLAAELVGKLAVDRPGMAGISLTVDTSAITAIGNDFGYEFVFARQLEAIGRTGDVLVGISTSGRSRNVVAAFEVAQRMGIHIVAMTGSRSGPMSELADEWLAAPHEETQRIQEAHIVLGHIFCGLIESAIHGGD